MDGVVGADCQQPGVDRQSLGDTGLPGHICVTAFGLVHVHYPNGWYVAGAGEGGMEWGFILLVCLAGVMRAYWPRKRVAVA